MDIEPKKDSIDPGKIIECQWAIDSETGDKVLIDLKTSKEIGRWKNV